MREMITEPGEWFFPVNQQTSGELLRTAVTFAPQDTPLSLARFPRHALRRMEQLEVSPGRMQEWANIFAVTPSTPPPR